MRRLLAMAICGLALGLPASAWGDGPTVGPLSGGAGTSTPSGRETYVAVPVSERRTLVERIQRDGGAVETWAVVRGLLGVAAVGYDGAGTGLAADGRVLVLQGFTSSYPIRRTRLAVVAARSLRVRKRITLRGNFVIDAISPDGRWLYLLHYRSPNDFFDYEVRAYDLRAHRLLARPIVDPREADEKMAGQAMHRTTSADGRWVYTVYQRQKGAPFVHALDTVGRTARCIDLPDRFDGVDVRLALTAGGSRLRVTAPRIQALIDLRSFAVVPPRRPAASRHDDRSLLWPLALVAAPLLLGGVGLAAGRRRPRHPATAAPGA